MVAAITITGAIILTSDMPDDFNANSSRFSARFPKVIRLARSTARGKAMGTRLALVYRRNSEITLHLQTLPDKVINILPEELHQKYKNDKKECQYERTYKRLYDQ